MAAAPSRSDRRAVQNIRLLDGEGWYMRRKLGGCVYSATVRFCRPRDRVNDAVNLRAARRRLHVSMGQQRQALLDQQMGVRW